MERFIIEGGHKLSGTLVPGGNKNEALPALAASLFHFKELTVGQVKDDCRNKGIIVR
jgi:cyclase